MFCIKCGKEISEESNFCPNCGHQRNNTISSPKMEGEQPVGSNNVDWCKKIDYIGVFKILSLICIPVIIWLRICFNEIEVVYSALAQDDYYVISDEGITWLSFVSIVYFVGGVILLSCARKYNQKISAMHIVSLITVLLLCVVAAVLRFPAPY